MIKIISKKPNGETVEKEFDDLFSAQMFLDGLSRERPAKCSHNFETPYLRFFVHCELCGRLRLRSKHDVFWMWTTEYTDLRPHPRKPLVARDRTTMTIREQNVLKRLCNWASLTAKTVYWKLFEWYDDFLEKLKS